MVRSTGAVGRPTDREVVASFYPLAWVTERVAGDDWTVTNLTTPGGEPHDLELSIAATADLAEADLVVYLDGFQPAVDDAVETNVEGATLDAADVVELRPLGGPRRDDDHAHEEGHDHGDLDPHFWLDPLLMADLADAVADQLAELDPDERRRLPRQRRGPGRRPRGARPRSTPRGWPTASATLVVVSHDAFGYLARYGLHLEPIAGLSPDAEPTPAALAAAGRPDRGRGPHHRLLRAAGQPGPRRDAGHRPRHRDRRARPDRGPHRRDRRARTTFP